MDAESKPFLTSILKSIKKEHYPNLILILIIISLFGYSIYLSVNKRNTKVSAKSEQNTNQFYKNQQNSNFIIVDIEGAVLNPGVYELEEGKRINDLIVKAGGFSEEVNYEYVSKNLNKSEKLKDSQKLYIPFESEQVSQQSLLTPSLASNSTTTENQTGSQNTKQIDINTATKEELDELPGIGEVTAENIITNRPYSNIEELKSKKVVTGSRYESIKDLITVSN